jgi:hypothetical protein
MKTRYFIPIFLLFTMVLSASVAVSGKNSIETRFQQANESYSRGDYQKAIEQYIKIIKEKGYSTAVLTNLANSYVQTGETGRAVLNYERALRLAPSNSDIKSNLNMVRKNNGLFPKDPAWSEQIIHILTINQWTIMACIALLFCSLSQFIAIRGHLTKKVTTGITITSIFIFGLAASATAFHYQYFNPSVVITPKARLLVSPFTSSASIGTIQEGRLLYPEKNHGDYVYVIDETNRKGWIHFPSIEAVCVK